MSKLIKVVNHTVRTKDGGTRLLKGLTRGQAIKVMCMECLGWDVHPKDCTSPLCPVFPYRGPTEKTLRGE